MIEAALSHPGKTQVPYTRDELEVAMLYLQGQITLRQYGASLGYTSPGNASHRFGALIKHAIVNGWITLNVKK